MPKPLPCIFCGKVVREKRITLRTMVNYRHESIGKAHEACLYAAVTVFKAYQIRLEKPLTRPLI